MGYWGWRPVTFFLCLSVFIVSCSDSSDHAPGNPPTLSALDTLIARTPHQFPDDNNIILPFVTTLSPQATQIAVPIDDSDTYSPLNSTPLPLNVTSPTCYEEASGAVLCLGQITNDQPQTIKNVALLGRLFDQKGKVLRQQITSTDLWTIPVGGVIPYRIVFPAEDVLYLGDIFGGVHVDIWRAEPLMELSSYVPITVVESRLTHSDVQVSAQITIQNDTEQLAETVRISVILTDEFGRVVGYRVVERDRLRAGESRRVTVNLTSQLPDAQIELAIYAQGLR